MKKILNLILCGILLLGIIGCGNNENTPDKNNNNSNNSVQEDEDGGNSSNENNMSSFQKAIGQLEKANSVEITYSYESEDTKSNFNIKNKGTLIIDYQNQLVHKNTNYSYVSNYGGSSTDENVYWDLENNRHYLYDDICKTWYWYQLGKDDTNEIYMFIDYLKELEENDANIVSNNYHFADGTQSIDIFIEDDMIKSVSYSISSSNSSVIQRYEFNFISYNTKSVQLNSEVKNAVDENNLCD